MTMHAARRAGSAATAILLLSTLAASAQEAPVYPTPQAAPEALVRAMGTGDVDRAFAAIDPATGDLVKNPDPEETLATVKDLLGLCRARCRFVSTESGVVIELGEDGWPFPVPLASGESGRCFDIEAGRIEVPDREIGCNELEVIGLARQSLEIQSAYPKGRPRWRRRAGVRADADLLEGSARRAVLDRGDGPVGDIAAPASLDGYAEGGNDQPGGSPGGQYFRVLAEQVPAAPGVEMSFLVNGNMVAGHAFVAVPAEYGASGINSFITSGAGVVYQADPGEMTLDFGFETTRFGPSEGWEPVE
jgi:hypothetical protein